MDVKTVIGRTLFFIFIVGFIVVFTRMFGDENTLIGVMIIVAALMLMTRDMTTTPLSSLASILGINIAIGLGTFFASAYPVPGIFINFILIFTLVFFLSQDSRSSVEFPFLLGYALMMSMPVTPEGLPVRLLALAIGSVFIVVLNLLANRGKNKKMTCHAGILSLLDAVNTAIDKKIAGEAIDTETFRSAASAIHGQIFDRLKKKFYTSPENRSVMNMAISLERLGIHIAEDELAPKDLEEIKTVLSAIRQCTEGKIPSTAVHEQTSAFVSSHQHLAFEVISGLELIDYELSVISKDSDTPVSRYGTSVPKEFSFLIRLKEDLKPDTMAFSYAFRLALLISIFEFVAAHFDLLAARWLTFTAIAISVRYIDMDIVKAKQRLRGVIAGILIFSVLVYFVTDYNVLFLLMLLINYLYTLAGNMRYDIKMMVVNISVLLTVLLTIPGFDTGLEASLLRLGCILIGTIIVIATNRLVFPYKISTENIKLSTHLMSLTTRLIDRIFRLKDDKTGDARDLLSADLTAEKLRMNLFHAPDKDIEEFLHYESEASSKCAFYRNVSSVMVETPSEKLRDVLALLIRDFSTAAGVCAVSAETMTVIETLTETEKQYAKGICDILYVSSKARDALVRYMSKIDNGYHALFNPYKEYAA